MDKVIFREYDIRGIVPDNINEEVAYKIGKSFGSYIQKLNKKQVLIGYDNRLSSPSLASNLIKGILSSGADVINLGLVTTPMYYYARTRLNIWSGIMITASHNPKEYNGFKMSFDEKGNAVGEEIYNFRDFTFDEQFLDGEGKLYSYNIKEEYVNLIVSSLNFNKKIKVVIDCGNGTGSIIIKDILDKLPLEYYLLYGESDGTFPSHHPDPAVASNLVDLQKKVVELKYDLGFAIDADADRVRVVDEKGNIIDTDYFMAIMYKHLKLNNKKALFDVKCSKSLIDELDKLGYEKIMNRTGNSYQYRKVFEENIEFGGEYSGHLFFKDKFKGFDDGIYAGLRMCELLSNIDSKMSELTESINKYYSTDEIKIKVTENNKFLIVDKIKQYAINKNYKYNDIDGVRIEFNDSWALVRASNTGPNLTVRFEASNKKRLDKLQKEIMDKLNEIINECNSMKTVVITGSARGLGFEMAKEFINNNFNVVISDINIDNLKEASNKLNNTNYVKCDVTNSNDIVNLINFTKEKFGKIDIWINNAGVNQPQKAIWDLTEEEIKTILDVDLKGTIMCCNLVIKHMENGFIYNVEGYGSNDAKMLGLSIYGTSKRAITYFTEALAKECETENKNIKVGKLSLGIMITDFITNALGNKDKIELSDKTKKVYNILGDYPDVVAKFLVKGMIKNKKNNAKIEWLTNKKAFFRFLTAGFKKKNYFK